jgi:hypothetical protein
MTAHRFALIGISLLCCVSGAAAPAASPPASPTGLGVSLLDVMRASVQIPADGIWGAAGGDKLSDDQWLLADQDSVNLIAAASLIAMPGAGKNDRQWVANTDWQGWVRDFRRAALDIHSAVKAHDLTKLSAAGDRLTQVCEDCHAKYRPATASDGVTRYPFYPKRELGPQ